MILAQDRKDGKNLGLKSDIFCEFMCKTGEC